MSNYQSSAEAAFDANCALGPEKCGYFHEDGICLVQDSSPCWDAVEEDADAVHAA